MNLGTHIAQELYRLSQDGPDTIAEVTQQDGRLAWTADYGDQRVRLTFSDYDRHSAALHTLEVSMAGTLGAEVRSALHTYAAHTTRQLTYLEEPLAVWELSDDAQGVQLRSYPPLREDVARFYWEVYIAASGTDDDARISATIARYRWEPGMRERRVVDYPATYALLGRLAQSLSTILHDAA
jgi:hypothetical protein